MIVLKAKVISTQNSSLLNDRILLLSMFFMYLHQSHPIVKVLCENALMYSTTKICKSALDLLFSWLVRLRVMEKYLKHRFKRAAWCR